MDCLEFYHECHVNILTAVVYIKATCMQQSQKGSNTLQDMQYNIAKNEAKAMQESSNNKTKNIKKNKKL